MAVRNALRRLQKWDIKLAGDVLSERVANLKPMMKSQIEAEFPALVEVDPAPISLACDRLTETIDILHGDLKIGAGFIKSAVSQFRTGNLSFE